MAGLSKGTYFSQKVLFSLSLNNNMLTSSLFLHANTGENTHDILKWRKAPKIVQKSYIVGRSDGKFSMLCIILCKKVKIDIDKGK